MSGREHVKVQVGRWTYHFQAPAGLVIDVVPRDDTAPKSAQVLHWPTRDCREEGGHEVGGCGLYDYITMPVRITPVEDAA